MSNLDKQRSAQAQIRIIGSGLSLPKTSVRLNAGTTAYISLRKNRSAPDRTYGLAAFVEVGGSSGTLIFSYAATDWFYISDEAFQALKPDNLRQKNLELDLQLSGTLLGSNEIDVTGSLINAQGASDKIMEIYNVRSHGFQMSTTSVRGKLYQMPKTKVEDFER